MSKNSQWGVKYRPRELSQVLGQDFPKRIIYGALGQQNRPRTWLLHGPWGSGKTTTARILAKSLVCPTPSVKGEACNRCDQCRFIDEETSPNYLEVDSASFGNVESIGDLLDEAKLAPIDAPARVLVLDEAHMITKPAQNKLLKSLEEGVGQTTIILVTTDPQKLLGTICSRCITIPLSAVDRASVTDLLQNVCKLEGAASEDQALRLIVEHTYGHIRDALNMAQQLSMAGMISLEETKRYLSLHLDESSAKLLLKSGENWDEAVQEAQDLIQDSSPEELWDAMRRAVIQSKLHHLSPTGIKPNHFVVKISELYGARLTPTSEWAMGEGSRIQVRTSYDLIVAMSFLRERLGANLTQVVTPNGAKHGSPKWKRNETTLNKVLPQLPTEGICEALQLIPVTDAAENTPAVGVRTNGDNG